MPRRKNVYLSTKLGKLSFVAEAVKWKYNKNIVRFIMNRIYLNKN